ncbi:MAG: S8 family serine peptidase [Planctomycetota bacterium]
MRVHALLVVAVGAVLGATLAAQSASTWRVIDVAGSGASVRVATDARHAEVSRDGGETWRALPAGDPVIDAQYGAFDPRVAEPIVSGELASAAASRLYLVQFETAPIDEYRHVLRGLGVEVHSFVPDQSYVVRMDRDQQARVQELSFVRWVGDYHPAYRLEPAIVAGLAAGIDLEVARYNILVVDRRADDGVLEQFITQIGGTVDAPAMGGGMVSASLDRGQLLRVAHHDSVMWLDRWTEPGVDMNNALVQSGARELHNLGAPIDGKGMTGHVYEGIFANHSEFAALPPYRTTPQWVVMSGIEQHGTNTGGEIYSRGVHPTNPNFRGGVPFAQMWYTLLGAGTRYNLYFRLVDASGAVKAMTSTASWGGGQTNNYTAASALMDTSIFDFDLLVTQSQSNTGGTPSRPEAWAKNAASVGGFWHRNNTNPNDDCWCRGASRGPASDGRIGVTFTGYFDNILTTTTGTPTSYTGGFGGTSGATPLVNGLAQLGIQMFTDGMFGYPAAPTFADRFEHKPHFTTSKAMLMATTRQVRYNSTGITVGATRVQQGWGFPHVKDLYDQRDDLLLIDEDNATLTGSSRDVLLQGQSRTYYVWVPPGTEEFRAAMTYADQAPNPVVQSQHRLNNLDLEVIAPDGTRYAGNWGLRNGATSEPAPTQTELLDTEEMVIRAGSVQDGAWTVTVSAPQIVADGHVETRAFDADYALAVRGIKGGRSVSGMIADLQSTSPGDLRVSVSNVPTTGWVTGRTFFSANGSRRLGTGNWFGLELDSLSLASFGFPPSPGNVFAFTNTAGAYPYTTFTMPAPVALAVSGVTFDVNVVLYDAAGQIASVSNTDRDTVQ